MNKKQLILLILLVVVLFPEKVQAVEISPDGNTYTYNICKEGCEYTNIPSIPYSDIPEEVKIVLKIGEGNYYQEEDNNIWIDEHDTIIEGVTKEDTIVNIKKILVRAAKNVKIRNITFNKILEEEPREFLDLWAVDNLIMENVNVIGTFYRGIALESADTNSTGIFDNVYVEGATEYGIYIGKRVEYKEKGYKIINSSLENNFCSILIDVNHIAALPKNNKKKTVKAKLLSYKDKLFNLTLENNKINCICASREEDETILAPTVYISPTNTWSKYPTKEENIFEVNGGKVVVEQATKQKIVLRKDSNPKVTELFDGVDVSNAVWENSNPEVAIIEENEIIPLSVGSTEFSTEISEIEYKIDVEVTKDMLEEDEEKTKENLTNPLTATPYIISIIAIIIFIGYDTIYRKKEKKNKK